VKRLGNSPCAGGSTSDRMPCYNSRALSRVHPQRRFIQALPSSRQISRRFAARPLNRSRCFAQTHANHRKTASAVSISASGKLRQLSLSLSLSFFSSLVLRFRLSLFVSPETRSNLAGASGCSPRSWNLRGRPSWK